MSKNYKIRPFRILKSINVLLLISASLAIIAGGLMILVFAVQNNLTAASLKPILNCVFMVFPIGLLVLSVAATIITSVRLSKKSVYINNFSSLESLSNLDILCLDKGSAITDGELIIKKNVPLKALATEEYLAQWISNVLKATDDNSAIARALLQKYDLELTAGVVEDLPFDRNNKYMGASFTGGKTIIIGKIEELPIKNVTGIIKRCEEEFNNGYTVLVVSEGKEQIKDNEYPGELEPLALIVLKDHVRESASEVFKWFKNNGIKTIVISSDSPLSTSVVAIEAGVDGADKYVSLEATSAEEIENIAMQYTVFGDTNAGQKRVLIDFFRKQGKKVMLIGEGVNDCSALKHSDCSMTINSDEDAQNNESDIVLTNSSFGELPNAIKEINALSNKMLKIASLFVMKTVFVFVIALVFVFASLIKKDPNIYFPLTFNHFLLWDIVTSGVALLFLLLEKNDESTKGHFSMNLIKKSIPGTVLLLISSLMVLVFYALQKNGLTNLGIYSIDTAVAMIAVIFNTIGLLCLYKACSPLNKYRITVLASASGAVALSLVVTLIITLVIKHTEPVLQIPYLEFNGPAIMTTAIIVAVSAALFVFIYRIIDIEKGEYLDED